MTDLEGLSPHTDGGGYRPDIDGLRAVAITMVVGFHVGIAGLGGGFVGVDVFFVISGYLIIGQLVAEQSRTGRLDLLAFFTRRVRRLVPAALLMIAATLLLGLLVLDPLAQQQELAKSAIAAAGFGANIYYWHFERLGYFETGVIPPPLLHTWSLSLEEQFYVLAPLTLMVLRRVVPRRPARSVRPTAVALALCTVVSLLLAIWVSADHPTPGFYLPTSRAYEFTIGGLIGLLTWRPPPRVAGALGLLGGAGLVVIAVHPLPVGAFPGAWALLPVAMSAAVVLAGTSPRRALVSRLLCCRPVVALGRVSYGWYLWHFPLLALVTAWNLGTPALSWRLLTVGVALLIAVLSWRYVEQPLRRGMADQRPGRVLVAGGVAAALVCSAAFGYGTLAKERRGSGVWGRIEASANDRPGQGTCAENIDLLVQVDRCELTPNSSSRPTLVIWGDSHAWQYVDGLRQAAQDHGVNLVAWVAGGCPPYDPTGSTAQGLSAFSRATIGGCDLHNAHALADIRQLARGPQPVRVVLTARWDLYLSGSTVGLGDEGGQLGFRDFLPTARQRLIAGAGAAVEDVAQAGAEAELVASSPELPRAAPQCVLAPLRRFTCDVLLQTVEATQAGSAPFLSGIADRSDPPAPVDDPRVWLCDSSTCHARWRAGFTYFDDDHLSASRSLGLAPEWRPTIDRLLAQVASAADPPGR